jgi:hypothetical protein
MSRNPEVINRTLQIFSEQYVDYVKEAIIWLEVYTGEKSKRSIYELRDALDHIALALEPSIDDEQANTFLNAAEEHLRRAAVEPAEWLALEELKKLLKIRGKGFWWWRLLFLKPPNSKEFDEKIFQGKELIVEGRKYKAISLSKSYNSFKKAFNIFGGLLRDIQPVELYGRLFAVALAIVIFILGTIVTLVTSKLL